MVSVEGEKNTFNVLNRPFYNEYNSCFEFIIFRLQFMFFLCDFYVLCVCFYMYLSFAWPTRPRIVSFARKKSSSQSIQNQN